MGIAIDPSLTSGSVAFGSSEISSGCGSGSVVVVGAGIVDDVVEPVSTVVVTSTVVVVLVLVGTIDRSVGSSLNAGAE